MVNNNSKYNAFTMIDKKDCGDDFATIKFCKANNQLIFNEDGINYLKNKKHPELNVYDWNEEVLFSYDQIHIRFTDKFSDKCVNEDGFDGYYLIFYLLTKDACGNGILEYTNLYQFDYKDSERICNKKQTLEFLKRQKDTDAKYIIDMFKGLKYASASNYGTIIDDFKGCLDDNKIVKEYNYEFDSNIFINSQSDISKMKYSIDDVKDLAVVSSENSKYKPLMIDIKDDNITVSYFYIKMLCKDKFKIVKRTYYITKDKFLSSNLTDDAIIKNGDKEPQYNAKGKTLVLSLNSDKKTKADS